jgi:hypothetical protein
MNPVYTQLSTLLLYSPLFNIPYRSLFMFFKFISRFPTATVYIIHIYHVFPDHLISINLLGMIIFLDITTWRLSFLKFLLLHSPSQFKILPSQAHDSVTKLIQLITLQLLSFLSIFVLLRADMGLVTVWWSMLNTMLICKVCNYVPSCILFCMGQNVWPPLWSSGQSSWLQIRRPGFDSRHYQKKKVVGLEWGALSLMSTTEELLDRKVAAPV